MEDSARNLSFEEIAAQQDSGMRPEGNASKQEQFTMEEVRQENAKGVNRGLVEKPRDTDDSVGTRDENLTTNEKQELLGVGWRVLSVANERSNGRVGGRPFSDRLMDVDKLPASYKKIIADAQKSDVENVDGVGLQTAVTALAVEAVFQVNDPGQRQGQIIEEGRSLHGVGLAVRESGGLIVKMEEVNMESLVGAGREALARRKNMKGLEDSDTWDDAKVVATVKGAASRAGQIIGRKMTALQAYTGGR